MSRMHLNLRVLASMTAAAIAVWPLTAVAGSSEQSGAAVQYKPLQVGWYKPLQPIRYEYGSKLMAGHFVQQGGQCLVSFTVSEKFRLSEPILPITPAKFSLILNPGQVAGLDSAEQRSLNVICGESAKELLIDFGETALLATRRAYSGALDAVHGQ